MLKVQLKVTAKLVCNASKTREERGNFGNHRSGNSTWILHLTRKGYIYVQRGYVELAFQLPRTWREIYNWRRRVKRRICENKKRETEEGERKRKSTQQLVAIPENRAFLLEISFTAKLSGIVGVVIRRYYSLLRRRAALQISLSLLSRYIAEKWFLRNVAAPEFFRNAPLRLRGFPLIARKSIPKYNGRAAIRNSVAM